MMRRPAGLDTDQTGRQFREERHDLRAPQRPAQDNVARGVNAMNLEHALGQIEA
jgi:hypothetical protein